MEISEEHTYLVRGDLMVFKIENEDDLAQVKIGKKRAMERKQRMHEEF